MTAPRSIAIPSFFYGTAWKEERTEALTAQALRAGFRAIDTANQRKHYAEVGVGDALAAVAAEVPRAQVFLQTKFTYVRGQDARLPYDPHADLATQVAQSFASSLEHLRTTWIDSYVLHGPMIADRLVDADWAVWRAMSALAERGQVTHLGISNVSAPQLAVLLASRERRPAFVQNRCYARDGWDRDVRALCGQHGVRYQGFSLLTANRRELASPTITGIAKRLGATPEQVVFRFAMAVGMLPLTGSSDPRHLRQDLEAERLTLSTDDVAAIEGVAG